MPETLCREIGWGLTAYQGLRTGYLSIQQLGSLPCLAYAVLLGSMIGEMACTCPQGSKATWGDRAGCPERGRVGRRKSEVAAEQALVGDTGSQVVGF